MPIEHDLLIDVSDRLYNLLKKDSDLIRDAIKDFKNTVTELIAKFDKNFENLTRQLENVKK